MSPSECREFSTEHIKSDIDVVLVYGAEGKLHVITLRSDGTLNLGVGKSHCIKKKLKMMDSAVTLPINESFTDLEAIHVLQKLSFQKRKCGIYINYTMIHPGVSLIFT